MTLAEETPAAEMTWAEALMGAPEPKLRVTKYRALANGVEKAISSGALKVGDKLPPVRQLAWKLGVTPGTVARAYSILTDAGQLKAVVGRGTFVAAPLEPDFAPPIEVDSAPHRQESRSDHANLLSPHLPSMGQAQLIRQLLAQIAEDPPSGMMHYPDRTNGRPAQAAVLSWLADVPLGPLELEDVVLTNGGQNAIMLVMQAVLHGRRPVILTEELSYPGFRRAAELLRAEVISVPMDSDGMIPEALDALAVQHDAQLVCTSPEVHNPTTFFTPLKRRSALVAVARRRNLQILDDDCYRIGPSEAPSYRMLAPERSWYVTSISKSLTPALRIGAVAAPRERGGHVRRAAEYSFFGLPTPMADLCAALLTHKHLPDLTTAVRREVNKYIHAAVNGLGGFNLVWRRNVPFLWLYLPEGWRASAFCAAAEAKGIQIRPAEEYALREARAPHAVRLAINAGISLEDFEGVIERLRVLLDNPPEILGV